ncbi:MAG: hypothetical protein R3281_09960 [Balneolaceae bacterium]|nr:hypothetical protein [Balneolaceae bacterium]
MKHLLAFAALLAIVLFPNLLSAQPGLPDAPDQAPIDGGLVILAAGGGTYAIKKLREEKE